MIGYVFRKRYGRKLPAGYVFTKRHSRARAVLIPKAARYPWLMKERATNAETQR
jgi:hypothetical protein